MLAVDTNVLVRILIDDPDAPAQCAAARRLAAEGGTIYVAQIVQVETVWVLEGPYRFSKSAIVGALNALANNAAFVLQQREAFAAALHEFNTAAADFADCLILAEARAGKVELATFDKKLGRLVGVRLVS